MRPIKFRAWDTNENKWVDDEEIWVNLLPSGEIIYGYFDEETYENEGRFEIMFSTGLFEKKTGREIYGGDIVKWYGYEVRNSKQIRPERKMVIGTDWISDCFYLRNLLNSENTMKMDGRVIGSVEVIGNVWENPELLEA